MSQQVSYLSEAVLLEHKYHCKTCRSSRKWSELSQNEKKNNLQETSVGQICSLVAKTIDFYIILIFCKELTTCLL